MASSSIKELYECYDIVSSHESSDDAKKIAYKKILDGVNGDEKEKRLASQFISKFFKIYPDLYEVSFNKLLDLCEDDNVLIRKQVIQYLPSVGKAVAEYIPKIADTLTQMLVADDNSEILLIYAALNNVLKLDFKVALEAIFHQLLTQLDEAGELINTFAFKYLNEKLGSGCELQPEMETFVETSSKRLLTKLIGREEFSLVIGVLSSLKVNSTLIGRQKLVNEISEQTKLLGKIDEPRKYSALVGNCKQAIKLLSKNVHADELLMYVLRNVKDIAGLTAAHSECDLYQLMKCVIDLANRGQGSDTVSQVSTLNFSGDDGLKSLCDLFRVVLEQLPPLPADVTDDIIGKSSEDRPKLAMAEASLLAAYYLCKHRPESISDDADSLKQFRLRLQFLGRVNQAANKLAADAVSKIAKSERQSDDCKDKVVFSRVTSNLQLLVREFFKSPPAFKVLVLPSWVTPPETVVKRPNPFPGGNEVPAKGRDAVGRGVTVRRGARR